MKQNQNQRILAEKNNISDSELNDISSIVEIGIKSNYAMLNAIYNNKAMSNTANAKATMLKILNVLSSLLSHLGPLSLKTKPQHLLQKLLIELIVNASKYKIDKSYPLQSLLTLSLTQATLNNTINTINTLFDTGFVSLFCISLHIKTKTKTKTKNSISTQRQ